MRKFSIFLMGLFLFIFLFSCQNHSQNPEEMAKLEGEWLLVSVKSGPHTFSMASQWIIYHFFSSGEYEVIENNAKVELGKWQLNTEDLILIKDNLGENPTKIKFLSEKEIEIAFQNIDNTMLLKKINP